MSEIIKKTREKYRGKIVRIVSKHVKIVRPPRETELRTRKGEEKGRERMIEKKGRKKD